MSMVLCVRPILGKTQRLRVMKRRESIVRTPIMMGTDRCTMTSGLWYRTHAERGSRDTLYVILVLPVLLYSSNNATNYTVNG
jgi:hypothetical protein